MKAKLLQDCLLVLRLNRLDYVPSGLYSSQLLLERGHEVVAVEYGFFQRRFEFEHSTPNRLRLGHPWLRRLPGPLRSIALHSVAAFRLVRLFLKHGRPRLLLAEGLHEQTVAWVVSLFTRVPYAVHVHEVFETKDVHGWNRLFLALEGPALRNAAMTVFPEATRAEIYRSRYNLQNPQYIAFNCPRLRGEVVPTDWRARLGLPADARLLGYWGGQGRSNALDQAIRAVARDSRTYFLLWGWSSPEDREYFKKLAQGVGATHQVLFLGELPDNKWSALAGLDASLCLYEPRELRLKHLATASNKFMESLAVGVPVLTSDEPDFRTLVEFHDVGVCSGFSVDALARALKDLFEDAPGLARRRANCRRSHREVFHYEYQFRPALRALESLLAPARSPAPVPL